jgi:GWxTD domain-containing protein
MKLSSRIIFSLILLASLSNLLSSAPEKPENWKTWLIEVEPIMTKAEKAVFKSLQTEEDRKKFQQLFWKVRDPDSSTPENEFRKEYYRRRQYAEKNLEGVDSDRGRIYLLLGKPGEKYDFTGSEKVIDCELWVYQSTGLPGLPPMMDLIFYKENNIGNYKLYYPGMNSPLDILSTSYMPRSVSKAQAYKIISMSFPELGRATLSVIPDEANAGIESLGSGTTLSQIFTLPEREVGRSYLKNFSSAEGVVDVTYSTKEIAGKASLALSYDRGFRFLNYALLPDIIHTVKEVKGGENADRARISLNLRIEDLQGKTIYQQERLLDLKFNEKQKKVMLDEKKLVFKDFAPIIEGEFNVHLTFINKATDEFFVHKERLNVSAETVPLMVGYKVKEAGSDYFLPFRGGAYKVSLDPRSLFTQEDSVEGIAFTGTKPEISLVSLNQQNIIIPIVSIEKIDNYFIFRRSLRDVRPGNYTLRIQIDGQEVSSQVLSVLSFKVEKPLDFERSEPAASLPHYTFILGQEYLDRGEFDPALENFQKLPAPMWNSTTLPVIARAYYLKKDYPKVVELLEGDTVEKTYSVLLLLGNSCLEIKKLAKAAEYFELLRKYGDTAEKNRVLGAIYFSLGEKEKAQTYWDRAKSLETKAAEKTSTEKEKKEP